MSRFSLLPSKRMLEPILPYLRTLDSWVVPAYRRCNDLTPAVLEQITVAIDSIIARKETRQLISTYHSNFSLEILLVDDQNRLLLPTLCDGK